MKVYFNYSTTYTRMRTRVCVYRVYYLRVHIRAGATCRTITTGWSALQDGAAGENQDLEKTIYRPSSDTGIKQNTNRGARIRPSNFSTCEYTNSDYNSIVNRHRHIYLEWDQAAATLARSTNSSDRPVAHLYHDGRRRRPGMLIRIASPVSIHTLKRAR